MAQKNLKHLTLLHSNDMHGDFLAEEIDNELVGGVSLLSGYVNQVRRDTPNTLYMIAGDMFRGSLIDTEFKGISTIEIMNVLGPDIVSLGNHELDYGIAHLLFLERCCKFPIVNANIYIRPTGMRLFQSHRILHVDGMKILVMGLLTEDIMSKAKSDMLLGTFVDLSDAAREVGIICNSYKNVDIDFTILLTHIGFAEDLKLAEQLDPKWGVDVIIGGHSHTYLDEPAEVNNILIVQAGIGTDQIGRFEIEVNTDTNSVDSYTWETVPIDDAHCEKNEELEHLIYDFKRVTDEKYGAILTSMVRKATHPSRYQSTSAGNLFCDALKMQFELDIVMLGSGSLRAEEIGPIITVGDLLNMYPYDETLVRIELTGKELKKVILHAMKKSVSVDGSDSEYYQFSKGVRMVYSTGRQVLTDAVFNGEEIRDQDVFAVGLELFHYNNIDSFLGLDREIIEQRKPARTVTGNIRTAIEEYFREHNALRPVYEKRTITTV